MSSTANWIQQHPTETLEIALGVALIVAGTVLTFGLADVFLVPAVVGAAADAATIMGFITLFHVVAGAAFVIGIPLLLTFMGGWMVYDGIQRGNQKKDPDGCS